MTSPVAEQIRERARRQWEDSLQHRFFTDVQKSRLPEKVFRRYLRVEYGFIDTAARTLGAAVFRAPGFAERRYLTAGLYDLVTEQEQFFQCAFQDYGMEPVGMVPAQAEALHRHFLDTAEHGTYEDILACMLGAEWLYFTWCSAARPQVDEHTALGRWVALHTGVNFHRHVQWLQDELDRRAEKDDVKLDRLAACFAATLRAENAFHEAAYS